MSSYFIPLLIRRMLFSLKFGYFCDSEELSEAYLNLPLLRVKAQFKVAY